jgi:hypothetical protein
VFSISFVVWCCACFTCHLIIDSTYSFYENYVSVCVTSGVWLFKHVFVCGVLRSFCLCCVFVSMLGSWLVLSFACSFVRSFSCVVCVIIIDHLISCCVLAWPTCSNTKTTSNTKKQHTTPQRNKRLNDRKQQKLRRRKQQQRTIYTHSRNNRTNTHQATATQYLFVCLCVCHCVSRLSLFCLSVCVCVCVFCLCVFYYYVCACIAFSFSLFFSHVFCVQFARLFLSVCWLLRLFLFCFLLRVCCSVLKCNNGCKHCGVQTPINKKQNRYQKNTQQPHTIKHKFTNKTHTKENIKQPNTTKSNKHSIDHRWRMKFYHT